MGAIDNLISAINTAIADGKTTPQEKANVDAKFALYNDAISDFYEAVEVAKKAIEDKLKSYTDIVSADLTVANGRITAEASRIDTINNTISTAGWITAGDGNLLYAAKTLENGNNIISYINQNATTTTINSSKINLVGAVTFSMFNSSLQSDFNGKANSSDLGSLAGKNKVSASDLATALQNTLNSKLEQSDLDNDIITFARLGSTIVEGGYIKTSLLNVIKIAAVEGTIAGFKISNQEIYTSSGAYDGGSGVGQLSSTEFHLKANGTGKAYLGYSGSNTRAEIGLNTYNGSNNKKIMCDLRDTASSAYTDTKIGLYVDIYDTYNAQEIAYDASITENRGATAIYINRGHVTGLKRHLRHISGNNTAYLNKDDSLVHFHNTSEITAYLPTGCEDGQEIWVMPWNTTVKVKTYSGQYIHRGGNNSETEVSCTGSQYHIFIYCAYNGRWVFGYLSE